MPSFPYDDYYYRSDRDTIITIDYTRSAEVIYTGDNNEKFKLKFHQKPNPIGFHACLPGDKPLDKSTRKR